jgi:hypothetical protein
VGLNLGRIKHTLLPKLIHVEKLQKDFLGVLYLGKAIGGVTPFHGIVR